MKAFRLPFGVGVALAAALAGCAQEPARERATVERVVDGDTLVVTANGRDQRIRLLGIDTPESVKPDTPVECGAKAAARSLRQLAPHGARARLTTDPASGDERDAYGRTLAFVTVGSHDLGLTQIRRGWAQLYAYRDRDFSGRDRYERASGVAERRGVGVHRLCSSVFHDSERTR